MKQWIVFFLIGAMLLSMPACTQAQAADLMEGITPHPPKATDLSGHMEAVTDFSLRLTQRSLKAGTNALVSPLSVLTALAMTANGAREQTLAQMEAVFGIPVQQLNQWLYSYQKSLYQTGNARMRMANSIWFADKESFCVEQDFLQTNADYYGAQLYKVPFDNTALAAINNWVDKQTDGMIPNILDQIPENAVMYLVNALAFEAEWVKPYEQPYQIHEGRFTTADGTARNVDMMNSEESWYLEDDGATGFMKYYKGGNYAFVALLPKEGMTPADYLGSLDGAALHALLTQPQSVEVHASLPKFEMAYSLDMASVLEDMGMVDAFDSNLADFENLGTSTEGNLCINRVLHKTAITVAEQGTKAGAATAVEMVAEGAIESSDFKTVILDRPFVYMIIDCGSRLPFFIGTMEDPQQTSAEGPTEKDFS